MPLFIDVDSFHYSVSGSRKVHILTSERWDSLQYGSHQFLNWWLQHPTGMLRFSHSSPTPHTKKEAAPRGQPLFWCERWDSNPHGGCHTHLKRDCLPFQHSRKPVYYICKVHLCQYLFGSGCIFSHVVL